MGLAKSLILDHSTYDVDVAWLASQFDDVLDSGSLNEFDDICREIGASLAVTASLRRAFQRMVVTGQMSPKAFAADIRFWQVAGWPSDQHIKNMIDNVVIFNFSANHFMPGRKVTITTIGFFLGIQFDHMQWDIGIDNKIEVYETTSSKTDPEYYFRIDVGTSRVASILDPIVYSYCEWVAINLAKKTK
jgi:hypothetical protein